MFNHYHQTLPARDKIKDPTPMHTQTLLVRDKIKYCSFHQDYGHTTKNYIQLKQAIEMLIKEGHLKEYISGLQQKDKAKRIIDVITPQFSSIKQMKKKIYNLNKPSLRPHYNIHCQEVVSFSKDDLVLNEEARVTLIVLEVAMT